MGKERQASMQCVKQSMRRYAACLASITEHTLVYNMQVLYIVIERMHAVCVVVYDG